MGTMRTPYDQYRRARVQSRRRSPRGAILDARRGEVLRHLRPTGRARLDGLHHVVPWPHRAIDAAIDSLAADGLVTVQPDRFGRLWVELTDQGPPDAPHSWFGRSDGERQW